MKLSAPAILALSSLAALAACNLLGSTASTVGSLGSLASQGASQGSGASSAAMPDFSGEEAAAGPVGRICGNRDIEGIVIPAIEGDGICGVADAVQVASVSGIAISPQPTVTCDTAEALNAWVKDGVKPAIRDMGERLRAIEIAGHYSCGREDGPGHGTGQALDVLAFRLRNGEALTVGADWNDPERGATLRRIHQRACGPFSRTLGPDAAGPTSAWLHYDIADPATLYCR